MSVVLLRGVNFGFWSHLGVVQGKTPLYLAMKDYMRRNIKTYISFMTMLLKTR